MNDESDTAAEAIRRLEAVVEVLGYWIPLGKAAEFLAYAPELGEKERRLISALLGEEA